MKRMACAGNTHEKKRSPSLEAGVDLFGIIRSKINNGVILKDATKIFMSILCRKVKMNALPREYLDQHLAVYHEEFVSHIFCHRS